jgi:hypothetical protein
MWVRVACGRAGWERVSENTVGQGGGDGENRGRVKARIRLGGARGVLYRVGPERRYDLMPPYPT